MKKRFLLSVRIRVAAVTSSAAKPISASRFIAVIAAMSAYAVWYLTSRVWEAHEYLVSMELERIVM